jgi:hypothetical protein
LGEKQIGFGGVLVLCNGASISLLDEPIGYQADREPAVYPYRERSDAIALAGKTVARHHTLLTGGFFRAAISA